MKLVILESPYAGDVVQNLKYARKCLAHSLSLNEAPIASHLLFTQEGVLSDNIPEQRLKGIEAGFAWMPHAKAMVVYTDLGISHGMSTAITRANALNLPVMFRQILTT